VELLRRNPKKWKSDATWQNLQGRLLLKKGCFVNIVDDDYDDD
jgi:hypothetical protein